MEKTLYNDLNEEQICEKMNKLLKEGQFNEAMEIGENYLSNSPESNLVKRKMLKISRRLGLLDKEKEILYTLLDENKISLKIVNRLIILARKEGNSKEEKRLLKLKLTKRSKDDITKDRINKIERTEEIKDCVESNNEKQIKLEQKDLKYIYQLIYTARENEDLEKEVLALKMLLEIQPEQTESKYRLKRIEDIIKVRKLIEMKIKPKVRHYGDFFIDSIREKIYDKENVNTNLEEIRDEINQVPDETTKAILISELSDVVGLRERAKQSISKYKKNAELSKMDKNKVNIVQFYLLSGSKKSLHIREEWDKVVLLERYLETDIPKKEDKSKERDE